MRKIVAPLLVLLLLFTLTPRTFADSFFKDVDNPVNPVYSEDYSEAANQLEQLNKLGYIDEIVTEQDLREESQFSSDKINDEQILSEGTYLVGIDTSTSDLVDINEFINKEQKETTLIKDFSDDNDSQNVTPYNSLLVYSVAFKTWITGAGSTTSKVNHSVEVTGVYGLGTRPTNYTVIARIKRATSPSGTYTDVVNQTKTVALKQVVTIATTISSTYYWKSDSDAYANFPDRSYPAEAKNEGPWLLNKKGVQYPDFTDPNSNKVMTKPASTAWSSVSTTSCALTTTERTAYRKWFDTNYKALNWADYEIHHIRPCKWGGTKDYSNLIPLPTSFHRSTVSPWWVNY